MEKANKKVSILLTPCSSQNKSAKQQCGSYQMFMWPKNLQQAEVARYVVVSGNRCISDLSKPLSTRAKPEVMEKANKKVSILLTPCTSQNNSAKQQCGSYQMFMCPKTCNELKLPDMWWYEEIGV